MVFILLITSCCKEADERDRIFVKYPELDGKENTYGVRIIRTKRGDLSQVLDTLNKNHIYTAKEVGEWIYVSKDLLPVDYKNQPDLIIYVEIVATTFNGLLQDSIVYKDTISNFQYEVGRCNIENLSYEFNGVTTNSREILIVN